MKRLETYTVKLEKIVGGGQTMGTLPDGRKLFVWGGLPGETVVIQATKTKSKLAEGFVTEVITASSERVSPRDPDSYLSTSPWQIMSYATEVRYKTQLIDEAFALHHVTLPGTSDLYSNSDEFGYRNKVEFSWYGSTLEESEQLDLAFFKRGSHGKVVVNGTSLAIEPLNTLARAIRDLLQQKGVRASQLKTLLVRCNQLGESVWQLYIKDKVSDVISANDAARLPALGGEVIYSDPRSPASRVTERLARFGNWVLEDTVLSVPFQYACEGFFQINLPVYEQVLADMQPFIQDRTPVIDLYAGVGSIGLTVGGTAVTLVEVSEHAVREMKENICRLRSTATAVLAPSEKALDYITPDSTVIVDPPRAGLHTDVSRRLLDAAPPRIIYLSCNPVTQARDTSLLLEKYQIVHHKGYNFFPRTPHTEHLLIFDRTS